MLYFKECELKATRSCETFMAVAEYCFHWSLRQGWFQLDENGKLPGGKKILNRDGSRSLKLKYEDSLFYEAKLKPYDSTR